MIMRAEFKNRKIIAKGNKDFQVKYIRWSYRIRGNEARIQIKIKEIIVVFTGIEMFLEIIFVVVEIKIAVVRSLIIMIFAYSAIKIRANPPPLYSILNPDTSSDSPSARSNGVRLVSAKHVINQATIKGSIIKHGKVCDSIIILFRLND
jgi:hypothetical protein